MLYVCLNTQNNLYLPYIASVHLIPIIMIGYCRCGCRRLRHAAWTSIQSGYRFPGYCRLRDPGWLFRPYILSDRHALRNHGLRPSGGTGSEKAMFQL